MNEHASAMCELERRNAHTDVTSDEELFDIAYNFLNPRGFSLIVCSYNDLFDLPEDVRHAPNTAFIILVNWSKYKGHWVCAWRGENSILNYFDSFGKTPVSYERSVWREGGKTVRDNIVRALRIGRQKLIYNEHKYQKDSADTCGKWCVVRLYDAGLNNTEFYKKINRITRSLKVTPDDLIRDVYERL
jgi:hypothetical protein